MQRCSKFQVLQNVLLAPNKNATPGIVKAVSDALQR